MAVWLNRYYGSLPCWVLLHHGQRAHELLHFRLRGLTLADGPLELSRARRHRHFVIPDEGRCPAFGHDFAALNLCEELLTALNLCLLRISAGLEPQIGLLGLGLWARPLFPSGVARPGVSPVRLAEAQCAPPIAGAVGRPHGSWALVGLQRATLERLKPRLVTWSGTLGEGSPFCRICFNRNPYPCTKPMAYEQEAHETPGRATFGKPRAEKGQLDFGLFSEKSLLFLLELILKRGGCLVKHVILEDYTDIGNYVAEFRHVRPAPRYPGVHPRCEDDVPRLHLVGAVVLDLVRQSLLSPLTWAFLQKRTMPSSNGLLSCGRHTLG